MLFDIKLGGRTVATELAYHGQTLKLTHAHREHKRKKTHIALSGALSVCLYLICVLDLRNQYEIYVPMRRLVERAKGSTDLYNFCAPGNAHDKRAMFSLVGVPNIQHKLLFIFYKLFISSKVRLDRVLILYACN